MPMRLRHPMHDLPTGSTSRPPGRASRPSRWTGAGYAAVLLAALASAWLQPGRAEVPGLDASLLALADWAGGGLAETASPDQP